MTTSDSSNAVIAERLEEVAALLEQQDADPFRVTAYRRAARSVRELRQPLMRIHAEGGRSALVALPAIGERISRAIEEMLQTGRWAQLERLRGESEPEKLFQTLPGIGPKLAGAIHEHLHVDTLADLEAAAHDGRLEDVPGIGPRTAAALRATLSERLSRSRGRADHPISQTRSETSSEPDIAALLHVDALYRQRAESNTLPTIAPRRFNPEHVAWLPILHTEHGGWSYTAMYSNTARAHSLARNRDWVVLYFARDHHDEGQRTVVTETHGPLQGERVIRGRESECLEHHARRAGEAELRG
ncbi:MAG: DNA-binding protein [Gammaproteobacteria bacterium]|nr:DNA-binding protein [Gammaproteobacteria bacterium]